MLSGNKQFTAISSFPKPSEFWRKFFTLRGTVTSINASGNLCCWSFFFKSCKLRHFVCTRKKNYKRIRMCTDSWCEGDFSRLEWVTNSSPSQYWDEHSKMLPFCNSEWPLLATKFSYFVPLTNSRTTPISLTINWQPIRKWMVHLLSVICMTCPAQAHFFHLISNRMSSTRVFFSPYPSCCFSISKRDP